jgi:selenocysteine lyase/cysteine desulfurase
MKGYKHYYQHFLNANPHELHFAAHSHHFWPDVTRAAQLQAWDDAARFNDRKWEHLFSEVIPKVQKHIADILNLKSPEMIALAPNTHDLLVRLFSELLLRPKLTVLTTDSEFHSFSRQLHRWEEAHSHLSVTRVKTLSLLELREEFIAQLQEQFSKHQVVFLSQVFFNSGLALTQEELLRLINSAPKETVIIIDGYHGFAALPLDLSSVEGRIFYLGGGYKYAQGGEGVGFMVVPHGAWRPVITGWFAEYAKLSSPRAGEVGYSDDGMAFWGATLDPSGWYRFNATWDLFQEIDLSVEKIHQHIVNLQTVFLDHYQQNPSALAGLTPLFQHPFPLHGHFLTFEARDTSEATLHREKWLKNGVYVDQRGARLRFGFGLYHDRTDIPELFRRLSPR